MFNFNCQTHVRNHHDPHNVLVFSSNLFMLSIVDALSRWVLGSEQQDFLRTCNTGLKRIPHPIFLEALSRSLQRGYRPAPEDPYRNFEDGSDSDSDTSFSSLPGGLDNEVIPLTSSRPGIPYELVVIIFRYAGFHRPRSEDLIPFQEKSHDVRSEGSCAMVDIAVSKPLTSVDLKTLCALRISELSPHLAHSLTYSSDPLFGRNLPIVTNS